MGIIEVKDFNKFELRDMLGGKYLELLIDTKNKKVYHVQSSKGHIDIAKELIGKNAAKEDVRHLVSAIIEIEDKTVKDMNIGFSSFESGFDIKHSKEELAEAKLILNRIIKLSEQLGEVNLSEKIQRKVA